jgi:hypothetical protein
MIRLVTKLALILLAATAMCAHALNAPREIEPNETPGSATPIKLNDGSIRGQIKGVDDFDYYRFDSPGGLVRFLIGIDSDCSAGEAPSGLTAGIYDSNGVLQTFRLLTGCTSGAMTILDANTLPGTYYLLIAVAFHPAVPPAQPTPFNWTNDDYVITPLTQLSSLSYKPREVEPNNTPATASAISLGGGEVRGQLSGSFDLDYFSFNSPVNGTVRFVIGVDSDCASVPITPSVPETGIRVSIRSASGTLITSKDLVGCTSGTTRAAVTLLEANTTPGAYYLLFQPKDETTTPVKNDYVIYPFGLFDPNPGCSMDLDGNGSIDPLTDGIMLMRAFFGLTGTSVTNNALGAGATRTTWAEIRVFLNANCGTNFTQ